MAENLVQIHDNNGQLMASFSDKTLNHDRVVLAQIDAESRNVKCDRNAQKGQKKVPFGQKQINTKPFGAVNRNSIKYGVFEPQKATNFSIYCDDSERISDDDECDDRIGDSIHENRYQIDANHESDAKLCDNTIMNADNLMESLAIEEESGTVNDVSSDESAMTIETDDDNAQMSSEIGNDLSLKSYDSQLIAKCKDYCDDIHLYLLNFERNLMPDPYYMTKQPEINTKMRSILIDWMVEVTGEYKMLDETLFLAVNCIDRFLSVMSISRQSFQLLGTAALFISSKYEEIYPPDITEFVYITDDSYSKEQILNMEKTILKVLEFNISAPTVHYFIDKLSSDLSVADSVKHLAEYLCCLTLLEAEPFLQYFPSEIAFASIILAAQTLGYGECITDEFIKSTLSFETQLKNGDINDFLKDRQSCIEAMHKMQLYASKHPQQAIQSKYSCDTYYNVSMVEALNTVPRV